MTATFVFRKAVKTQEKLHLALDGPTGSGKTWTALTLGTWLADKEGGRVALIDSERSSAKKYAKDFDFDHLTLPDFDPRTYTAAIRAAVEAGYAVLIVDSLSHAWEGALDMKDRVTRASASGDSFGAWRQVTPVHNELVDTMLRSPLHLIVTMRVDTEYLVDPTNQDRSKRVQKVGLKPVQRKGVEYEFDVVGDMDQENTLVITKTRCSAINGSVFHRPDVALARTLHEWLTDGEPLATGEQVDDIRTRVSALSAAAVAELVERVAAAGLPPTPEELLGSQVDQVLALIAALSVAAVPDPPTPTPLAQAKAHVSRARAKQAAADAAADAG